MLAYFGETDSEPCGICDVCTGRNKSDLPAELFESLEKKIGDVLHDEPLAFDEILQAFALKRHESVAQVIAYLLDEGKLLKDEADKLYFRKKS